ncbi:MAG: hypothetical protein KBD01_03305 [Acidobacteria bacterium]|nr:hypothetical protein [Acidobacteriota bacterium]
MRVLISAAIVAAASFAELGDEVVAFVREQFYDATRAGAWAERHAGYGADASSDAQFAALTNRLLGELRASHTYYYPLDDPRNAELRAIFRHALETQHVHREGIGADFACGEGGCFVRQLFAGGPAQAAGLLRGDLVVKAGGAPFVPGRAFEGRAGENVTLEIRRQRDGPLRQVTLVPRRTDPSEEWVAAEIQGTTTTSRGGRTIAYVPIFSCAGDEPREALADAIERHAAAQALVVDFRNGWGGCNPDFVDLFCGAAPELISIARDGERSTFLRHWRKPLVLLVNGGTRSGKEIVAHAVRKHRLGVVVGERTAGAVLAGKIFVLSNDAVLLLAAADVLVDGERLEGIGVEPDVAVPDRLEFAAGADPQLERALALAAELATNSAKPAQAR